MLLMTKTKIISKVRHQCTLLFKKEIMKSLRSSLTVDADPNPTDDEGISALDLADSNQEIRDLILKTYKIVMNPKKKKLQTSEK